jgi:hypothetical protein
VGSIPSAGIPGIVHNRAKKRIYSQFFSQRIVNGNAGRHFNPAVHGQGAVPGRGIGHLGQQTRRFPLTFHIFVS